jgi:hypothetical protein
MDDASSSYSDWQATPDILAAGQPDRPRRRLPVVLSSAAAVVVVVAAGGGLFAYHELASSGAMPDTLAPKSSIAFAELDLDPSAAEKISAYQFAQKFPDLPKAANADAMKDALLTEIFADSGSQGQPKIDYATEVKPWLGARVALDEFVDSSGRPQTVGILSITDTAMATAALTTITAKVGGAQGAFVIKGHFAIVGISQVVVTDAVAQAAAATIDDNPNYSKDVATLHSGRIMTAWVDAGGAVKALSGRVGQLLNRAASSGVAADATGRIVIGVRLSPNSAELEGRVLGSTGAASALALQSGDAVKLLGALPAGTAGGISVEGPGAALTSEIAALKAGPSVPQLQKYFDTASTDLGISVPGDVENLLGSSLAAGISSVPGDGSAVPSFTVITQPTDAAAGEATAHTLIMLAGDHGLTLTSSLADGRLTVSNQTPATATLGSDAKFSSMFASMPAAAGVAGYVDLTRVWAAERSVPAAAQHLTGVGFVAGKDSTSPVFDLTVTVG